jgi:hypothetical protein
MVLLGNDLNHINDMKQGVEIESMHLNYNTYASWSVVKGGIPQVSILGFLLASVTYPQPPVLSLGAYSFLMMMMMISSSSS